MATPLETYLIHGFLPGITEITPFNPTYIASILIYSIQADKINSNLRRSFILVIAMRKGITMTPKDQLNEEHEKLAIVLTLLEKVCGKMKARENVPQRHLEGILDFLKVFVDQCHHGKEEELLFPAIVPMERKLIGVLLGEHSQGRSYVRAMDEGLNRIKKLPGGDPADYAANAQKYIGLMTQHIQKENNILLPMLDRILATKRQRELAGRFEDLERKIMGEGRGKRCDKLFAELKGFYPE